MFARYLHREKGRPTPLFCIFTQQTTSTERVMQQEKRLPIGSQDFEDLRKNGFFYVDKTEYVFNLIKDSKYFFLSRPRRFGKSLFLSTLAAYFEGKKELFQGLYLERAEEELARQQGREAWVKHPVFLIDFSQGRYTT